MAVERRTTFSEVAASLNLFVVKYEGLGSLNHEEVCEVSGPLLRSLRKLTGEAFSSVDDLSSTEKQAACQAVRLEKSLRRLLARTSMAQRDQNREGREGWADFDLKLFFHDQFQVEAMLYLMSFNSL